jgi:hypothetical protein
MPEYEHEHSSSNVRYSSFWPLLIMLLGLTLWCGYQLYAMNGQCNAINQQYTALEPSVAPAQNMRDKFASVGKDLVDVAAKDANAAQIVKEAIQAGIFHVNQSSTPTPGTNSTTTPAEPAK